MPRLVRLLGKTRQSFLVLFTLSLLILPNRAAASLLAGKNVLILHSYHQSYIWTDQIMTGIMKVLRGVDPNFMPYVEYLDWKRFPEEKDIAAVWDALRIKYADIRIDAVITSDNKALEFAIANRDRLFPGAAIAFCGINDYTDTMLRGQKRVSGVVEDVDPEGTIQLITTLLPKTRELVLLIDDTESSKGVEAVVERDLKNLPGPMTLKVLQSPSPGELITDVAALKTGSVLLQGPYLRDRQGDNFSFEGVLESILPYSKVPIFSLWDFLAGKGITGGSLLSGELQGETAARIALRFLSGTTDIPVLTKAPTRQLVDYRQLQHFGLTGRDLPAGVEVLHRPPSLSQQYIRTILAASLGFICLLGIIAALLVAIHRRHLAERSLRDSEKRFRTIFDSVNDAIFIHDVRTGEILDVNRRMCEMYGMTREEALHMRDAEYASKLPPYTPEDAQRWLRKAAGGEPQLFEWQARHKDGHFFWVEVSMRRAAIGIEDCILVSVRDIAERKRAEDERLKLEQQLLHAQKLESLGVLAGGIAHDFNNILMAIIGNADLALMRMNKESPAIENLHSIEQSAARAADLAKQMLAYSGKGRFVVEPLDLNRLLQEMLHMLEVSISKKAVLRLNLSPHLPAVEADATQLRQIVMNLVINASEAIGDRSGVIAITTGCMDCDADYQKGVWLDENLTEGLYVFLEIADTGCGMDEETRSRLFDPFFTTKFTGRGLGMAAVLGIVRGHRGAIKVYSEPSKGSTFKVLLPASSRPAALFNLPENDDDWQGNGTVLLVDDEETVRGIGVAMLKELGFRPVTANDGREALSVFLATPDIACVILDLTMPHMDGEQCFRELRRIKPDVKVIMSSGYNEQEVTQKFIGKGLAGFVEKPYRLSTLKTALRAIL